mgnify:CR=1 FL=1
MSANKLVIRTCGLNDLKLVCTCLHLSGLMSRSQLLRSLRLPVNDSYSKHLMLTWFEHAPQTRGYLVQDASADRIYTYWGYVVLKTTPPSGTGVSCMMFRRIKPLSGAALQLGANSTSCRLQPNLHVVRGQ